MPCDLLGEYVIRETKRMIHHNSNAKTDHHLREIVARQVMTLREMRNAMAVATNATNYHQRSSHVDPWFDVRAVADNLLRDQVFELNEGRYKLPGDKGKKFSVSTDLHKIGCDELGKAKHILTYISKMESAFGLFDVSEEDNVREIEDEEDVVSDFEF
jgi:hypothetical protein